MTMTTCTPAVVHSAIASRTPGLGGSRRPTKPMKLYPAKIQLFNVHHVGKAKESARARGGGVARPKIYQNQRETICSTLLYLVSFVNAQVWCISQTYYDETRREVIDCLRSTSYVTSTIRGIIARHEWEGAMDFSPGMYTSVADRNRHPS